MRSCSEALEAGEQASQRWENWDEGAPDSDKNRLSRLKLKSTSTGQLAKYLHITHRGGLERFLSMLKHTKTRLTSVTCGHIRAITI